jgi:hypothetical protein
MAMYFSKPSISLKIPNISVILAQQNLTEYRLNGLSFRVELRVAFKLLQLKVHNECVLSRPQYQTKVRLSAFPFSMR